MEARLLGGTGLRVTRLGLGLAALGRPGYINLGHADDLAHDYDLAAMERRCHQVLDRAYGAGIRYLDAARSYGRSESFLASWLPRAGELTVGSKWGYTYTAGWRVSAEHHEIKDHSLATFERQLVESQTLLGPRLNLYQVHSATLDSGILDNREALAAMARARGEGLAIGLTVSGPRQAEAVRRALTVRVDGLALFQCVQATWNLLERSCGEALAEAHAAGLGVIVKEGVANGRLTARGDTALTQEAARLKVTPDALALAAVLAQPWADVVLSGAATGAQLDSNLGALSAPYDAGRLAALREEPAAYWATRGRLQWN